MNTTVGAMKYFCAGVRDYKNHLPMVEQGENLPGYWYTRGYKYAENKDIALGVEQLDRGEGIPFSKVYAKWVCLA